MPPPMSASTKRAPERPSPGGCSVAISTAETAAWVAKICPLPRNRAVAIASGTTITSAPAPGPVSRTSTSATAIPTATPRASSSARLRRWPTVTPSVMIAAIGAKNGWAWPTTSVANR